MILVLLLLWKKDHLFPLDECWGKDEKTFHEIVIGDWTQLSEKTILKEKERKMSWFIFHCQHSYPSSVYVIPSGRLKPLLLQFSSSYIFSYTLVFQIQWNSLTPSSVCFHPALLPSSLFPQMTWPAWWQTSLSHCVSQPASAFSLCQKQTNTVKYSVSSACFKSFN